ncbi:pilin [Ectobacillus funiculus]|uniref:Pilin n=1 Tax=Ectobacillus funiculus TaxID=137993 RepID=A0ABV5W9D1_9BACI
MPIIEGLSQLLNDLAGWIAMLALPVLAVIGAKAGIKYANSDDPHEAKSAFDLLKKGVIGVAIAVSATWIASKVMGYF